MNRLWLRERFDAVVLDVMMPGEARLLHSQTHPRHERQYPILMLTAEWVKTLIVFWVWNWVPMTTLPKPYNPRELLARLHAIMRRREPVEAPGSPSKGR